MKNYTPEKVRPTDTTMPKYIRKAVKIKRLCFGGWNADGSCSTADIAVAVMQNGDLIPFEWGGKGSNLSMADVKAIRNADHNQEFVYIGKVFDSVENKSRDNFAKVIHF